MGSHMSQWYTKYEYDLTCAFAPPYHNNADAVPHWMAGQVTGDRPPPCSYHTLTLVDSKRAVLFGGNTATGRTNDVYIMTLDGIDAVRLLSNFCFLCQFFVVYCPIDISKDWEVWPMAREEVQSCCVCSQLWPEVSPVTGCWRSWWKVTCSWRLVAL